MRLTHGANTQMMWWEQARRKQTEGGAMHRGGAMQRGRRETRRKQTEPRRQVTETGRKHTETRRSHTKTRRSHTETRRQVTEMGRKHTKKRHPNTETRRKLTETGRKHKQRRLNKQKQYTNHRDGAKRKKRPGRWTRKPQCWREKGIKILSPQGLPLSPTIAGRGVQTAEATWLGETRLNPPDPAFGFPPRVPPERTRNFRCKLSN